MSFLIQQTLIYAVPLMIVALAGIFSERSGTINLALEGIMAAVDAQLDVQLDGLVELGLAGLHNDVESFLGVILKGPVEELCALFIIFTSKQCCLLLIMWLLSDGSILPRKRRQRACPPGLRSDSGAARSVADDDAHGGKIR